MILERSSIQPMAPCMMSTLPCLVDWISADHSIMWGTTSSPSRSAISTISSPSVPISLPSSSPVIGMSPLSATLSLPGSIVCGGAAPARADGQHQSCAERQARAVPEWDLRHRDAPQVEFIAVILGSKGRSVNDRRRAASSIHGKRRAGGIGAGQVHEQAAASSRRSGNPTAAAAAVPVRLRASCATAAE